MRQSRRRTTKNRKLRRQPGTSSIGAVLGATASIVLILWIFGSPGGKPSSKPEKHTPIQQVKKAARPLPDVAGKIVKRSPVAERETPMPNISQEPKPEPPPPVHKTPKLRFDEPRLEKATAIAALTFDAGSSAEPTGDILNTLKTNGIHSTFFLTGKWAARNPEMARRIADEGHEIGNHSYSHKHLEELPREEILEDIRGAENAISEATGRKCAMLFRPPFGVRDKKLFSAAEEAGYKVVMWDIDSWDSVKKDISSDEITNRVLFKIASGDIVLFHCGSRATADALPDIIAKLRERGFQLVTVSALQEK